MAIKIIKKKKSLVYLGDLFTCTQQMHWGICLPYAIWHLYAMTLSQMSYRPALPVSQQVHNLQSLMLIVHYQGPF